MNDNEARHQLWATFSVNDHCRRGAFIAEVLLCDKLLVPVVPTAEDDLSPEEAAREMDRWKKSDWKPARQADIVRILGDRVEPIPWTSVRQNEWREEIAKSFAEARSNGYFMTGSVLQRFAPAMARTVVAVSPVYSLAELRKKTPVRRVVPRTKLPPSALLAVLGQELLVPSIQDGGYLEALAKAVSVAKTDEYREARQALYAWQQQFIDSDRMTDAASIEAAVQTMKALVEKINRATNEQKKWRGLKRAFSFSKMAFDVAKVASPVAATAGAAFVSLGSFALEQHPQAFSLNDPSIPAATMILGAREQLGVK